MSLLENTDRGDQHESVIDSVTSKMTELEISTEESYTPSRPMKFEDGKGCEKETKDGTKLKTETKEHEDEKETEDDNKISADDSQTVSRAREIELEDGRESEKGTKCTDEDDYRMSAEDLRLSSERKPSDSEFEDEIEREKDSKCIGEDDDKASVDRSQKNSEGQPRENDLKDEEGCEIVKSGISSEDLQKGGESGDDKENEKGTDEDDGFGRKIVKYLACGIKKPLKDEDIEPYTKIPDSWVYSSTGSSVIDDETLNLENISTVRINSPHRNQVGTDTTKHIDSDAYNFTHPQRGYLLLVINNRFYRQTPRQGAQLDLLKMTEVAAKLGLRILNDTLETQMNLSKSETMKWLKRAQNTDHTHCDCFMFMISTHGLEQRNPRKGGLVDHALVCADDKLIFTSTIMEMFNDTNCPTLTGKPKIFIIQACRGDSVDSGGEINVELNINQPGSFLKDNTATPDHMTQQNLDVTDTKAGKDSWASASESDSEVPSLQCDADMLVMYAVPPGMFAWRNTSDGSWMIHYLHEVLVAHEMEAPRNFLRVLTKVSARMSRRTTDTPSHPELHEKKAISVIEYKLTKDILFSY